MSKEIESSTGTPKWENELRVMENNSTEFNLSHPTTGEIIPITYTPSKFTNLSPLSPEDTDIRLVAASQLVRHELFLKKGLDKVSFHKNEYHSWNDAPMIGVEMNDGKIMVIDGSTRLGRVQALSTYVLEHHHPRHTPVFPIQVVDYRHEALVLGIWEEYHSIEKLLTKMEVIRMVLAEEFVEPKQTKFGIKIEDRILSIAQTQGEVNIPMNLLIGISLMSEDISHEAELIYRLR